MRLAERTRQLKLERERRTAERGSFFLFCFLSLRVGMCRDVRAGTCVGMCVGTRPGVRVGVRSDMCRDMCGGACMAY